MVWPEPMATAAGTRMLQLIDFFKDLECQITFVSAAAKSPLSYDLDSTGIISQEILLNNDSFDRFLEVLDPKVVVFDRFITEEQFGWRVEEICPKAVRVLDTEDLHFLRTSRELALKANSSIWVNYLDNDITKREVASIFRSDLSLIISDFEMSLLKEQFNIPASHLLHIPFLLEKSDKNSLERTPGFEDRSDFMTIGNFKHKPNADAVKYLYSAIWPLIHKKLPNAKLHIYGAYQSQAIKELHSPNKGFLIHGWVQDKKKAFENARICLAPLRFGAGQKGKLLDAMIFGTPSITSSIGAEGMTIKSEWNGFVEDDPIIFAEKAIELYLDSESWNKAQTKGIDIIEKYFNKANYINEFTDRLKGVLEELEKHRTANFTGKILNYHTLKGHKFMSKWIALKNLPNDKIIDQ